MNARTHFSTSRIARVIALVAIAYRGVASTVPPTITTQPTDQTINYVTNIVAGSDHSHAVLTGGLARAWGNNSNGQLGDGTTVTRLLPVSAQPAMAAGYVHAMNVFTTWGGNAYGQLGNGTTTDSPTSVYTNRWAVSAAAGAYHSVICERDGRVAVWGNNSNGQLGDGTTNNQLSPEYLNSISGVVAVSAGYCHTLVLKADGTVWAWGGNSYGQLGNGATVDSSVPVQIPGLSNVAVISAGGWHNLVLKTDGTVWAWGANSHGELGDGTTTNRLTPVQVGTLSNMWGVSAGYSYSLAVKNDGSVWAWGANNSSQLGDGTTTGRLTPMQVAGLSGISTVAAGSSHSLALGFDGSVWAWGANNYGQLGDGTTIARSTPVSVAPMNSCKFYVGAMGPGAFTYQWKRRPTGQSSFVAIGDDGTYSGTNTSLLTVIAPTPAMVGDQFLCVVTNSAGSTATLAATLLGTPPSSGKVVLTNLGQTSWRVPPGVSRVAFKVWAAGGLGNQPGSSYDYTGYGGGGGFVSGMYSVTPGQIINIGVGSLGGDNNNTPSASAVWVPGGFQLIAGGGGNGGNGDSTAGEGGQGGAGGPTGTAGNMSGGGGGSATAPGVGGTSDTGAQAESGTGPVVLAGTFSALLNGGGDTVSYWWRRNGGGGYYGGGQGANNESAGGGGGGSNFVDTGHGYILGFGQSLGGGTGNDSFSGGKTDPDYPTNGLSSGWSAILPGHGETQGVPQPGDGAVVILYNRFPAPQVLTVSPSTTSLSTGTPCVLTVSGGLSNGNWQWTIPADCIATGTTTNQVTITPVVPGKYTITVSKGGDANYMAASAVTATIVASGLTVLTNPGTYALTPPPGSTMIRVKAWGGGGLGRGASALGGGGGFASSVYDISTTTVVNVVVGAAGGWPGLFGSQPGGGASATFASNQFQLIAGGGGSAGFYIFNQANAGGGGGSGGPTGAGGGATPNSAAQGGAGGTGSGPGAGGAGSQPYFTGAPGTGPATLSTTGSVASLNNGGSNSSPGGSGYYGGGSGGYDGDMYAYGGGGGGSNFVDTNIAHGYISSTAVSLGGSGAAPANTTDINYIAGTGVGGGTQIGGNGCVVIDWSAAPGNNAPIQPDTSPPTAPTALNYADASATTITLIWRPATDNVGVTGYLVYRGTQLLGSTSDLTWTDNNLTPSTAYNYTVKAQDAAGNLSPASTTLNVSTTQDFSADSDHDGLPDATESALGTNSSSAATTDTTNQTQQNIHRPTL